MADNVVQLRAFLFSAIALTDEHPEGLALGMVTAATEAGAIERAMAIGRQRYGRLLRGVYVYNNGLAASHKNVVTVRPPMDPC